MEQAFVLMKHLGQKWSDIEGMASYDRTWMLKRVDRYFEERKDQVDREANKPGNSGSGGGLKMPK